MKSKSTSQPTAVGVQRKGKESLLNHLHWNVYPITLGPTEHSLQSSRLHWIEKCALQICVHLKSDMNVTLFGNTTFADKVNMKSYWTRVCPKVNDWCSFIERTQTYIEDHVKTDTKIGVMHLQAKECLKTPHSRKR